MRAAIAVLCGGKSQRMGTDKAGLLWQGSTLLERMVRELGVSGRELLISAASEQQAAEFWHKGEETAAPAEPVAEFRHKGAVVAAPAGPAAEFWRRETETAAPTEPAAESWHKGAEIAAPAEPAAAYGYREPQQIALHPRIVSDCHPGCGPLGGMYSVLREAQADAVFFCAVDMPFVTEQAVEYLEQFLCSDFDGVIFTEGGRPHPLCGIYRKSLIPVLKRQLAQGERRVRSLLDTGRIKMVPLEWSALPARTLWNLNTPEDYKRAVRPLVFCVSGMKNSGKTTLVEKLVRYFLPEFPKIGVIKHDGHDFVMDREGTDSFRAAQAGAQKIAVFSKNHRALLETFSEQTAEPEQAHRYAPLPMLLEQMQDMDMVILEGMKDSAYPKVELVRKGSGSACVCNPETLIAVAADMASPAGTPTPLLTPPAGAPAPFPVPPAGVPAPFPTSPAGAPAPFPVPHDRLPRQIPVIDWNDTERIAQAILRYFLPDKKLRERG